MSGVKHAAILLLGMGEEKAAKVLRYMDPKHVEKMITTMSEIGQITKEQIQQALDEFRDISENQTSLGVDSAEFIRHALIDALGSEKAENIIDRALKDTGNPYGAESLRWQDPKAIVALIRDEHPQIIAVILTYLDSEKAASVLDDLPQKLRIDVMQRIATIGAISPSALKELNIMLEESVKGVKSFKTFSAGGAKLAANIITFMNSDTENELMKSFDKFDHGLTEKIQEYIYPFEKLADIDKRSLQTLLRAVTSETLVLSLKGVDDTLRNHFLSNMSDRAASMLKDDLEAQGPVQLSKVMEAQKTIVATAQKMAKNGEIVLAGQSEAMVS